MNEEVDAVEDAESFPASYVAELREESAKHRTRANELEERTASLRTRLLAAEVRSNAIALADPADLLAFANPDDLLDDDGHPDATKIATAAEELATTKSHLAARRLVPDIGQGPRGAPSAGADDFASAIRSAAR